MPEILPSHTPSSVRPASRRTGACVLAVAAASGVLAGCATTTPPARTDFTPTAHAVQTARQAGDHQAGLVAAEDARLIAVRTTLSRTPTGSDGLQTPFRMSSAGTYTLVLTARKEPYTLRDLIQLEPQTLIQLPDKSFLIEENIVVAGGATLSLGGGQKVTVRLQSDARAFTAIVSLGGDLQLVGTAAAPLTLTSWDPATATVDSDLSDGRAYIRAVGGKALIQHVVAAALGFWSGRTGGVALTGSNRPNLGVIGNGVHDGRKLARDARTARKYANQLYRAGLAAAKAAAKLGLPEPSITPLPSQTSAPTGTGTPVLPLTAVTSTAVTGEIADSTFTGNAFGLYISDAQGVHVHNTTVQNSLADGVVLHHFVTGAAIDHVISRDNVGVGFSLSRGVQATVLTADEATHNGNDGFLLSGRPLATGPSAAGQSSTPYGNNELISSTASYNGRAGVQIVSGHTESVLNSQITGNSAGIIVGTGAVGTVVTGNLVAGNRTNGITVRDGSDATVTGNIIRGGGNGIVVRNARADLRLNVISKATLHGISFVGGVDQSTAVGNGLSGRGSSAIDQSRSTGRGKTTLSENDTTGWTIVHRAQPWSNAVLKPMNITLAVLIALIVFGSFRTRLRSGRAAAEWHPYATTQSLRMGQEHSPTSVIDLTDRNGADQARAKSATGVLTGVS